MYNFPEGDILKEFDEIIIPPSADKGVRLANYMIDWVLSFIFLFVFALCLGVVLSMFISDFNGWLDENDGTVNGVSYLLAFAVRPLYYVMMEGLMQGRTVGKLITGTVAIRLDGKPMTWKDVFGRSYAREVPFEVWSGFGTPWHDKWTQTTVVYRKNLMTR